MDKTRAEVKEHRKRCNANGFSRWYVTVNGRRRRIELQEYRGRLYLVGCLYSGLWMALDFEEPFSMIVRKLGSVTPAVEDEQ